MINKKAKIGATLVKVFLDISPISTLPKSSQFLPFCLLSYHMIIKKSVYRIN
jgi:hypothetical protein